MEAGALPQPGPVFVPRSRRFLAALSDDRLVEQVRRGSETAFEVLYDRHNRAILSFCRHMLGTREEAEDALQHVFIAAYNDLLASDRPIKLKAWLYTIARNRCLSVLRTRRERAVEHVEVSTAGLADQVQERQDLRELLADMRELPDDQRAALVLAELGDLSHADIGDVLGVEAVKVKSLVFQARSTLMEHRDARAIPCLEIREQLATLRGGGLRRGPLRKHVKACPGCREFRDEVSRQRAMMAAVLPVVPTLGLKHSALAAIGSGMGGGGAAAAGGAAGGAVTGAAATGAAVGSAGAAAGSAGGGLLSGLGSAGLVAKTALALTVGGAAVGGGVAIEHNVSSGPPSSPPVSVEQGTAHRSPVGADNAEGPPGTAVATPGATTGPNGVARRVRAHGAPATKHHSNPNASSTAVGQGGAGHAPGAQGQIKKNPQGGGSGTGNGGQGGKSSSGAKEDHTPAGHANQTGGTNNPVAGGHRSTPLDGTTGGSSSTTVPGNATSTLAHGHVHAPHDPATPHAPATP